MDSQSTIIILGIALAFIPNYINFIGFDFILTFHAFRRGSTGFARSYIPHKIIIAYSKQYLQPLRFGKR